MDFLGLYTIANDGALGKKRVDLGGCHYRCSTQQVACSTMITPMPLQKRGVCFFSVGDFEQINVLRVRLAMVEPRVHAQEFTADLFVDFGFEIVDHATVIKEPLTKAMRQARRASKP